MSIQCNKIISLDIFAKLLTSDSSVVSTKNFILRTSCLAALGLCQQAKYRAVKKIFLVFTFPKMLPLLYSYAFLLGIYFAVGQNLIL